MTLADRIVVMKDGYVQQIGTPHDVYFNPRNVFVAGFIGEPPMNFIRRTVKNGAVDINGAMLDLSFVLGSKKSEVEGREIIFGFRPEGVKLGTHENAFVLNGVVELTEMLGDNANVYMNIGEERSILKVTPHEIPELDQALSFSIPYDNVYLFDGETEKVITESKARKA